MHAAFRNAALTLALVPAVAAAQFTTFIPPSAPKRVADSVKAAVVVQEQVRADSVSRAQITDMKTWVDSASGVAVPPLSPVTPDTDLSTMTPAPAMRDGALAPNTATPLPMLALLGLVSLGAGLFLIRSPQVPAPARTPRQRG